MKILHTADWHLGKKLEGYSRLDEQKIIMEQINTIADEYKVDLVLICGDVFDSVNPPAEAEQLFYKSLQELSKGGERVISIIPGNHDSPNRLVAPSPLSFSQGIIILDKPAFDIKPRPLGSHGIVDSGQGFLEMEINGENVVLLPLPYPSESRLNTVLGEIKEERDYQKKYSQKVGEIFSRLQTNYRKDTINIAMSHIFVDGGEESDSERPIQVGGGMAVRKNHLPAQAQYIALGHLHRGQAVSRKRNAHYAGSPLQYSASEMNHSKSVRIMEITPETKTDEIDIEKVKLKNPKPIETWVVEGMEGAREKLKQNQERDVWAYLKIKNSESLLQSDIKEIKNLKRDLLSIEPLTPEEFEREKQADFNQNLDIEELFEKFYRKEKETNPGEEVMDMFMKIVENKEEENAT